MSDKAGKNPIKETHKKDEHSGDKKHGDHVKDKKGAAQDKHVDITKATAENLKDDTNALDKKQKKEGLSTNIETSEKAQTELHINKPATDIKDKLADTHDKAKDVKHDIKDKLKEAGKEVTDESKNIKDKIGHDNTNKDVKGAHDNLNDKLRDIGEKCDGGKGKCDGSKNDHKDIKEKH